MCKCFIYEKLYVLSLLILIFSEKTYGSEKESFRPYLNVEQVPENVEELWRDYDPRKEDLKVKLIREWKQDGLVCRYLTFKVGRFKGVDSRIAAYYTFPDDGKRHTAFVWCHGGGQRADRIRGIQYAKEGFASIDINWGGREIEKGVADHTDWGKVDASQGPQFYKKALRSQWKRNLLPDDYTVDSLPSPRNSNWFLLSVAARRAITFLEKQKEVDPNRLAFAGFSMGGIVTSMVANDQRLKLLIPFVGGVANQHIDFPSMPGSSIRGHFKNLDLYEKTCDPGAYWPLAKCPVIFINSSNDFNAAFDRVYQSMLLLKHDKWRVSMNMHQNHAPGPEQYNLFLMGLKQYLKNEDVRIPLTPPSRFSVSEGKAVFTVMPKNQDRLLNTEIFYSYDPNSITRFWNRAESVVDKKREVWSVEIPLRKKWPLYVFASCRYKDLNSSKTFTLTSMEQVYLPEEVDISTLKEIHKNHVIIEDFKAGLQDWSRRPNGAIRTYKFQSPNLDTAGNKNLRIILDTKGQNLLLNINVSSRFLSRDRVWTDYSYKKKLSNHGVQEMIIRLKDLKSSKLKRGLKTWSDVACFDLSLWDLSTKQSIDLNSEIEKGWLKSISLEACKDR